MPRHNRHSKNDTHSKTNPFDETCSYDHSLTLQGTNCDIDTDGKLNSNNSSIKKHQPALASHMSNETSIPMVSVQCFI
jgi:hypothetical protein